MSRALAAGAVLAPAVFGCTTGALAQGLISTQKLAASLANELVGESVAGCAQCARAAIAKIQDRMK
jgi:hypothetical protein